VERHGRQRVAALFVRRDSVYAELAQECFDIDRDARTYAGPWPVVAHPPCRAWGRLRHLAKPRHDERELARFAVDAVRRWGGVLEHPHGSRLWPEAALPLPYAPLDAWGGWSLLVRQQWFGHPAPKPTLLYIVGRPRLSVTDLLRRPGALLRRPGGATQRLSAADRERTPPAFAAWLCELAAGCR
jgi:hypothetical protein